MFTKKFNTCVYLKNDLENLEMIIDFNYSASVHIASIFDKLMLSVVLVILKYYIHTKKIIK